jgi:hypothetical protein
VAVTETDVSAATAVVVTTKLAVDWPAATVIDVGPDAAELFHDNETTTPPAGAALVSDTVPVVWEPPMTDVGLNATVAGAIALMFKPFDTVVPDATALIVAKVSDVTAVVVAVNVADV